MPPVPALLSALLLVLVQALVGCGGGGGAGTGAGAATSATAPADPGSQASAPEPLATPAAEPSSAGPEVPHTDGEPGRALLSIPRLGMEGLPVVPYRGWTDDAPGTEIQDGGVAASPFGPRGGTGPGGIGNYQVTAHRLSSTQAFLDLPRLRAGDLVHVDVGSRRLTYEVTRTRITSFREPASLRAQRAAVPGRPGVAATRAMITLSTCRTPEDRAEGNTWSDRFGNPEHRIDKIGVLRNVTRLP
ncbi:sortase domain-bontaining protein [uncultured Nocardioides sp.]|uniref:sortase domain-containing protein n=1 Tax=uncultured Nocardioides sp. TaxID=198441 RepID=UPI0026221793|nr:sortase [uncultured Nocardioides sp.]